MTVFRLRADSRVLFAVRRDGHLVAGPDEDGFTLAVAAGEGLESARAAETGAQTWSVWVSGDGVPGSRDDLPLALGLSASALHDIGRLDAVPKRLPDAEGAQGVIWIDVAAGSGPAAGRATAFLLSAPGSGLPGQPETVSLETTADLAKLLAGTSEGTPGQTQGPELPRTEPVRGPQSREAPPAPASGSAASNLDSVSQGAYISWSTYREGLPGHWRFAADRCTTCGHLTFPARGRCGRCGRSTGLTRTELPRCGVVVEAITTVHSGAQPTEFDYQVELVGSYDVALVRLAPEAIATLQVTDAAPGTLRVGDTVDTCLRRLYPMEGNWRYGRKARPRATPGTRR